MSQLLTFPNLASGITEVSGIKRRSFSPHPPWIVHLITETDSYQERIFNCSLVKETSKGTLSLEPRNGSWITKVRASSWRTWQNKKLSYHHKGDHDLFYFTMHTNILHVFFAPNCRF